MSETPQQAQDGADTLHACIRRVGAIAPDRTSLEIAVSILVSLEDGLGRARRLDESEAAALARLPSAAGAAIGAFMREMLPGAEADDVRATVLRSVAAGIEAALAPTERRLQ